MSDSSKKYILGVDFGSTSLIVKVVNKHAELLGSTSIKVPYLYPQKNGIEIDPDAIWELFVDVVKATFTKSDITAGEIKALGFCCQRGTIMLWNKHTGKPYCNLISWQDTRCSNEVDLYNHSWMLRGTNIIGSMLYTLCRYKRFLVMKILSFQSNQASMKLAWLLDSNAEIRKAMTDGDVCFGTLDSWILWKLTKGKVHLTDPSNAGATALFDPYIVEWSSIAPLIFKVPLEIFPACCDTSGYICDVDEEIFGSSFPVTAVVADTQAGLFAQCCFEPGQVSCCLGTGCFFAINTGTYAHASISGLYPQIGWKIGDELTYLCEGYLGGIAASIEWALGLGFFDDVSETSDIAYSAEDSGGVYFVPGFSGLSAPYQDPYACTCLIGIKRHTSREHIVRAILEGIAFRFFELYEVAIEETNMPFYPLLRICGGVSNNEFIMELVSSLTDCYIEKALDPDMSLLGAVFLAGLGAGIWKSKDDISLLERSTKRFEPKKELKEKYLPVFREWKTAVQRSLNWYKLK